jgi:hypothetical protein
MWPTAHKIKSKLGKVWSCVIMDRFGVCGGKDMTSDQTWMEYFFACARETKDSVADKDETEQRRA